MSFLPKKLLLLALLNVILNTHTSIQSYNQDIEFFLQEVKKSGAVPMTAPLKNIAEEIAQRCGVDKDVLFFESKNISSSLNKRDTIVSSPKCIIIATHDYAGNPRHTFHMIFDIYHEIGHLINGDQDNIIETKNKYGMCKKDFYANASFICSLIATRSIFVRTQGNLPLKLLAGAFGFIASNFTADKCLNYLACLKEDAADIFAYKKLLKNNDYPVVLSQVCLFLSWHEQNPKNSFFTRFTSSHPSHLNRALKGLKLMEEDGYNIKELISQGPPEFQELFKSLMLKHCPHYYKQKFS